MHPPIVDELRFVAEEVSGGQEDFSPDPPIHYLYFVCRNVEQGGEGWSFSRSFDDDDWGVCIIKEPQVVTQHGGILECVLTRNSFTCVFDEKAQKETRVRRLEITFDVSGETWQKLVEQARMVFQGEGYFRIET